MPSLATSTNMLLDCTTDAKSRLSELSSATPAIHLINDPFPFVAPKQHQLDYIHQQQRIHQQQQRLLLYTQERCRLQYLRFSNQHSLHNQSTVNVAKQRVDLVDDIWRLVTYILASDCKGLGRLMQVNRRLHDLIANDALLWRLTYRLTVSGSIFSSQKPLLSPAWIREEHGRAGSELYGSLGGLGATSSKHRHSSGSVVHGQEKVDIHEGDDTCSKGLHLQDLQQHHFTVPAPGLQLPSQLVLPHHRRIVSAFTSHTGPTGATVTPTSSATSLHHLYNPGPPVGYSSPQSTVSACASSSFHSMSEGVSQVLSNSTIPLTVVQQLVPSTTLKHHSPAVYWKHQVVEWLEQEKLRCLRLGLFWGFSLGSNRTHGHKLSW